jgi:hypothetical protein
MYVLYTNTSHGLGINYFNTNSECLEFAKKINSKSYKILPVKDQLPMQFYPAFYWNEQTNSPDINIYTAIELKKEELRTIRESLLQKLDIAFMKALEMNDEEKKSKIIFYKNELRDITTKFFPSDINILLYFYPVILNEIFSFVQN